MQEQASEFRFRSTTPDCIKLGCTTPQPSKCAKTNQMAAISAKYFRWARCKLAPNGGEERRPMAGKKDKARRYLRWAALNDRRAAEAYNGDLKTLFLQIAAQYRDLAEQIADPEQWQAKRDGRPK
jgi:hypothetical protein